MKSNSALDYFSAEVLINHYAAISSAHDPIDEPQLSIIFNEQPITNLEFNFSSIHIVDVNLN